MSAAAPLPPVLLQSSATRRVFAIAMFSAGCLAWAWGGFRLEAQAQAPGAPRVENPHWTREGCAACHGGAANPTAPPEDLSDAGCIRCHDGVIAKAEDHPVGRFFRRDDIRRPSLFPAPGDRLGCLTCHDVLAGCRMDSAARTQNPHMLRGPIHAATPDYCAQCHISDTHRKLNPHVMIQPSGDPDMAACAYCHTVPMPAGNTRRSFAAHLRMPEPDLCLGCHGMHVDFFDPGHTGASVTPGILELMLRSDRVAGLESSTAPQLLPLVNRRRVTCSTCHNPHQAGVFAPGIALDRGAISETQTATSPIALRLQGRELCHACHGF